MIVTGRILINNLEKRKTFITVCAADQAAEWRFVWKNTTVYPA